MRFLKLLGVVQEVFVDRFQLGQNSTRPEIVVLLLGDLTGEEGDLLGAVERLDDLTDFQLTAESQQTGHQHAGNGFRPAANGNHAVERLVRRKRVNRTLCRYVNVRGGQVGADPGAKTRNLGFQLTADQIIQNTCQLARLIVLLGGRDRPDVIIREPAQQATRRFFQFRGGLRCENQIPDKRIRVLVKPLFGFADLLQGHGRPVSLEAHIAAALDAKHTQR
ncbi:hypothetical protein LAL4801_06195 [Roseibium aggregatum]|uniref:Uncharacterized protein n=1 Tax=Roseibium aggregatum TaxID=187304 RepID=A0A0M6YCA2_9HYPH|nr:hypothetical protein LAL4801_06195 [Roseibium aggregatum]